MNIQPLVKSKKLNRQARMYEIKVSGIHFDQIKDGSRTFAIVPDDKSSGYEIGDLLIIQKYTYEQKVGEPVRRTIKAVQKSGNGLMRGFLVLGLQETIGD